MKPIINEESKKIMLIICVLIIVINGKKLKMNSKSKNLNKENNMKKCSNFSSKEFKGNKNHGNNLLKKPSKLDKWNPLLENKQETMERSDNLAENFIKFYAFADPEYVLNNKTEDKLNLTELYDEETYMKIFGDDIPALLLLSGPITPVNQFAHKSFSEAAKQIGDEILMSVVNINDNNRGTEMAKYFELEDDDAPAIYIIQTGEEKNLDYTLTKPINTKNIVEFLSLYQSNKLRSFYKSEPIPEINGENIKVVVASTFQEIVLDNNSDVMVLFYHPKDTPCLNFFPIYENLAEIVSHNKHLLITKLNFDKNDVSEVKIEQYPALLFYPKGNKSNPILYSGKLKLQNLISFLRKYSYKHIDIIKNIKNNLISNSISSNYTRTKILINDKGFHLY